MWPGIYLCWSPRGPSDLPPEPEVPDFVGSLSASDSKTAGVVNISIDVPPFGFRIVVIISDPPVAWMVMATWPLF